MALIVELRTGHCVLVDSAGKNRKSSNVKKNVERYLQLVGLRHAAVTITFDLFVRNADSFCTMWAPLICRWILHCMQAGSVGLHEARRTVESLHMKFLTKSGFAKAAGMGPFVPFGALCTLSSAMMHESGAKTVEDGMKWIVSHGRTLAVFAFLQAGLRLPAIEVILSCLGPCERLFASDGTPCSLGEMHRHLESSLDSIRVQFLKIRDQSIANWQRDLLHEFASEPFLSSNPKNEARIKAWATDPVASIRTAANSARIPSVLAEALTRADFTCASYIESLNGGAARKERFLLSNLAFHSECRNAMRMLNGKLGPQWTIGNFSADARFHASHLTGDGP